MIRDIAPRAAFALTGVGTIAVAAGLIAGARWATRLWPVAYQGRLAPLFVASVLAAVGAASLYIALSADWRAARPAGLALLVSSLAVGGGFLFLPQLSGLPFAAAMIWDSAVAAALGGVLVVNSGRYPPLDDRRMPLLPRASFVVFGSTLLVAGTALIAGMPHVFPWRLDAVTSLLYGAIFVGLGCNYLYGAILGTIADARVSLIGFLVYDLVLLPAFAGHFDSVMPAHRTSLVVYMAVLVYSALLAVYCLALDPRCRLGSARVGTPADAGRDG